MYGKQCIFMKTYDTDQILLIRDIIESRRSIRNFKDEQPDKKLLVDILDIARWAPSHCNTQNVFFIIIDDANIKKKIVDMGGSIIINKAPVGVLVLYSNYSDNQEYSDFIQSGAAVIQNMLLYAHAKGLGSCWIAHLPTKSDLRRLLNIPQYYDPIAYIILGYPHKEAREVPRKHEIEHIISYNNFMSTILEDKSGCSWSAKRNIRRFYYKLPTSIKKILNPIIDRIFVKKFEN